MKVLSFVSLTASLVCLVLGGLSLSLNSLDVYTAPLLATLGLCFLALFLLRRRATGQSDWAVLILCALALISTGIRLVLPDYLYAFRLNAIVHHSLVSALLLILVSLPGTCFSLCCVLGAKPRAYDLSRYPLLALPGLLALAVYAMFVFRIVSEGAGHLDWRILSTPFAWHSWRDMVWKGGWPVFIPHTLQLAGMRNHILGTFLLMGLTTAIALPVGVGVGVYTTEYSTGRLARTIKFSTQMLRAISVLILALTAYSLVARSTGTFLSDAIAGYYLDGNGAKHAATGSFLTAAFFIALLVIPIIAKSTEEGLRSLPRDITEGSLGLGASLDYSISRIALPWSVPNIITGTVLGCAEAAGSLAIIMFMGGTGEYGLSPLNQVTSLTYLIFDIHYGKDMGSMVPRLMQSYQATAAFLLLIIAVGLTVGAMLLSRRISRRSRGA